MPINRRLFLKSAAADVAGLAIAMKPASPLFVTDVSIIDGCLRVVKEPIAPGRWFVDHLVSRADNQSIWCIGHRLAKPGDRILRDVELADGKLALNFEVV